MDALLALLLVVVLVAVLVWAASKVVARETIFDWERGLEYRRGRFAGVLEPGQYWRPRLTTTVRKAAMWPTVATVSGQDLLTADAISIRVSLTAEYRVVDPVVALNEVESYYDALYAYVQLALREVVSGVEIDALLDQRRELGAQLLDRAAPKAERIGVELISVELRDIMFPGDLKRTFAQVVAARKEGLAALERARGETAALRNLANAAKSVEESPALLQLRLLQELGRSSGNTVVLGFPTSSTPLPLREGPRVELSEPPTETD